MPCLDEEQWTFLGHLYPIIAVSTLDFRLSGHTYICLFVSNSVGP